MVTGTTIPVPSAAEVGTTAATTSTTTTATAGAHTVLEGETLSGIAAANGITTESLAAFNGISRRHPGDHRDHDPGPERHRGGDDCDNDDDCRTDIGAGDGARFLDGRDLLAQWAPRTWPRTRPPPGPRCARRRSASSAIDIYPAGSLSAYRTYEQQAYLYDLYLAGLGAPANPPGTSSHEYGTAVDLASPEMRTVIDQIGPTYGWSKVHGPDEWWHVDYVGG